MKNKSKTITQTTELTGRSKQGVWQAYNHAKKKYKGKFVEGKSLYEFPVSVIADKKYSVLESIVKYLKEEYSLTYAQIARILHRDQRTIWTVYNKAKIKDGTKTAKVGSRKS